MTIEEQICTFEQAKRLKELDVKQESLFYWYTDEYFIRIGSVTPITTINNIDNPEVVGYGCGCCADNYKVKELYSAFTSAELGQLLLNAGFEKVLAIGKQLAGPIANSAVTGLQNEAVDRADILIYTLEKGK